MNRPLPVLLPTSWGFPHSLFSMKTSRSYPSVRHGSRYCHVIQSDVRTALMLVLWQSIYGGLDTWTHHDIRVMSQTKASLRPHSLFNLKLLAIGGGIGFALTLQSQPLNTWNGIRSRDILQHCVIMPLLPCLPVFPRQSSNYNEPAVDTTLIPCSAGVRSSPSK